MKVTLIIGAPATGKSILAQELVKEKKAVFIDGQTKHSKRESLFRYHYGHCTPETETIVLDDLSIANRDYLIQALYNDSIIVDQPYKKAFNLSPEIIITCNWTIPELLKGDSGRSLGICLHKKGNLQIIETNSITLFNN